MARQFPTHANTVTLTATFTSPWIPDQCVFVVIVVMTLSFSNLTLILSYHIMHTITETNKALMVIITLMLAFVTAFSSTYTLADCVTRKLHNELTNGTIPGYYSSYLNMIHLFENSEGTDLRLDSTQIPNEIDNFYCFTLSEEADDRVNNAIAYFYGLNSLSRVNESCLYSSSSRVP